MFSTIPMAPTALTLALRAASACISPTTQAAPAMSPFMSSMPAAGLIEMPPVSKHTPLPMKATGSTPRLPPFQRMMTQRLSRSEPWPDAEQRIHAELAHGGDVEHLDRHAELFQVAGTAGEFFRKEHVGRLVDEIAGEHHAVRDRLARYVGLLRRGHTGDRDGDLDLLRAILVVLALGLVAIEGIGAQPNAQRDVGGPFRLDRPARQVGDDLASVAAGAILPIAMPPSLTKVFRLEIGDLADADDDQARQVKPGRRQDVERRTVLALEPLGRRRPGYQVARRRPAPCGLRAEFEPLFAEYNENAFGGAPNGANFSCNVADMRGSSAGGGKQVWPGLTPPAKPNLHDRRAPRRGRPNSRCSPVALTLCCAYSMGLPWRGHFVGR